MFRTLHSLGVLPQVPTNTSREGKLHGDLVRISGSQVELEVRARVDGDERT